METFAKLCKDLALHKYNSEANLWKLIIAHLAYLIWTQICKRVISNNGRPFPENEI
ncbi:hypothetical protein J3R30DRAFT_3284912 [Lentinula aciculospora]|uniref:Uncharacterized protein n=1 Tax=Lentinula aciculospora TaxID=153920 RepID=A0A9W9AIG0_9AGAR|nr:hypothetical protein J3R30DRAFT_3284912 [Lentinula aciculospora]